MRYSQFNFHLLQLKCVSVTESRTLVDGSVLGLVSSVTDLYIYLALFFVSVVTSMVGSSYNGLQLIYYLMEPKPVVELEEI